MTRRPQLVAQLKDHEGLRLTPYKDSVGKWTIGYGHNLQAKPLPWYRFLERIPPRVAEAILDDDVDDAIADLDQQLPWWRELDEVRQQVMADLSFNMGIGVHGESGLRSFVNTLEAIREGRWDDAREGLLASKWARQVGEVRSARLARMMLTGQA